MLTQKDFHVAVGMQRKRISEEKAAMELFEEIRNGRILKQCFQHHREKAAAFEANSMRGAKSIPGLGKPINVIPAHEFFLLRDKYGEEAMHDKTFARDMQKHEPALAVNRI